MIIRHNREENAEIKSINARYAELIAEAEKEWISLLEGDEPDDSIFDGLTPDSAEWKEAEQKYNKALDEWENSGGEAARIAEDKVSELMRARHGELVEVDRKAMRRQFDKIKNDHAAIFEDFKRKAGSTIRNTYKVATTLPGRVAEAYVSSKNVKKMVKASLPLHYEAEKDNTAMLLRFDSYIDDYLTLNPYDKEKASKGAPRRSRASISDNLAKIPNVLSLISNKEYKNALTPNINPSAYSPALNPDAAGNIQYAGGKAYLPDRLTKELNETELMDITTRDSAANIDRPLLTMLYSILVTEYGKYSDLCKLPDSITISAPALAEAMDIKGGSNREYATTLVRKISSLSNLCGVIYETNDNGEKIKDPSFYPVINFMGYSAKDNTIKLGSPYIQQLHKSLNNASIQRGKKNQPRKKTNGDTLHDPIHSYLVYPAINKERNKAAITNVCAICVLIEQSGDHTATILASTIVDRNPELKERLYAMDKRNQNRLLKTTFKRTWELLADPHITKLSSVYQDIELPNPNNPTSIPTMKSLKTDKYVFPHKGKRATD